MLQSYHGETIWTVSCDQSSVDVHIQWEGMEP